MLDRAGYRSASCEMHYRRYVSDEVIQEFFIQDRTLNENYFRVGEILTGSSGKVVKDDHLIFRMLVCELANEVGPNESRPAGYQNFHRRMSGTVTPDGYPRRGGVYASQDNRTETSLSGNCLTDITCGPK